MMMCNNLTSIPNKIFADRGPQGGWMYRDTEHGDTQHEFIRMGEVRRIIEFESRFFDSLGKHAANRLLSQLEKI
jgi:hypothetical protein